MALAGIIFRREQRMRLLEGKVVAKEGMKVGIIGIGGLLANGEKHDGRACPARSGRGQYHDRLGARCF